MHLYQVQLAHIRYLQDDYASLVVQSKFNKDTGQFFRALQHNTQLYVWSFGKYILKDLKLASSLAAFTDNPNTQQERQSSDSMNQYRLELLQTQIGVYNDAEQQATGAGAVTKTTAAGTAESMVHLQAMFTIVT